MTVGGGFHDFVRAMNDPSIECWWAIDNNALNVSDAEPPKWQIKKLPRATYIWGGGRPFDTFEEARTYVVERITLRHRSDGWTLRHRNLQ